MDPLTQPDPRFAQRGRWRESDPPAPDDAARSRARHIAHLCKSQRFSRALLPTDMPKVTHVLKHHTTLRNTLWKQPLHAIRVRPRQHPQRSRLPELIQKVAPDRLAKQDRRPRPILQI